MSCPDQKVPGWLQGNWDVYDSEQYTNKNADVHFYITETSIRKTYKTNTGASREVDYMGDVSFFKANVVTSNSDEFEISGTWTEGDTEYSKNCKFYRNSSDRVRFVDKISETEKDVYYLQKVSSN